ncbi:MAG: hypothetical protein DF168_00015 [Candidatus Moanabacter tarae]|uniref:ATP-NAD kinase n=1 Tax=Candidatus Moanibacter tarae TaxID=2200854 RepID=A0A2Z4AAP6_9BACT|nr:MAG: hypothetical protein DF168_00015 [Candidatus Moanabacter tarae]|tara:strand:- start:11319 stop:12365 length:1047 start_codon:yes stop_codon:yes gene_type:complete
MTSVGIVANPASGTDIRRLVAHGTPLDNGEKANIVRRVLLGLESVGVEQAWIMPEFYGIGRRALDGLSIKMPVSLFPMRVSFSQEDSIRAAGLMVAKGVGCIVTIGGDGTNRVVAKASRGVPLMAISTGTNNVFPNMVEGTIAGMAAGLAAQGLVNSAVHQMPRLEIFHGQDSEDFEGSSSLENRPPSDIALIDATVYDERFVASRAIWDVSKILELFLTRPEPGNIGLSAIGAHLPRENLLGFDETLSSYGNGLYLRMSPEGKEVTAPIAPGLIRRVHVAESRIIHPGDWLTVNAKRPCVLALDGEREIQLRSDSRVLIRMSSEGPKIVCAQQAMEVAARKGLFVRN